MNLITTIALTSFLYVAFKSFEKLKINTFQAIVFNYLVCVISGTIFSGGPQIFKEVNIEFDWGLSALILGSLFISTFYLMALAAQKVSVAVSTVASKISLIVPVIFSIFVFKVSGSSFSWINYIGLALILSAIVLVTHKKEQTDVKAKGGLLLVVSIFICTGGIDTLLNYTQRELIGGDMIKVFPIILFSVAAALGGLVLAYLLITGKQKFRWKNLVGGLYLGIPNYFSIYFLIKTLEDNNGDGASVFPIVNMSVIILSSLLALLIYKERLRRINYLGIVVAVIGISFISWEEIFG